MSAIAGIWCFDGGVDVLRVAERMSNSLSLFGPDRHGLWEAPDRQLALIWRQFAVLPEDVYDRQPLRSPDGVHTLVADGRIDNIDELAGELDLPTVRDIPDAAIIMAAYRKWGAACLDRLVGEFAFAIWNSRDRSLFLARDALGRRPLFWARGHGFFGFATMPRGLFVLPDVSRTISERYLAAQFALLPRLGDGTMYRDLRRAPPGHSMTVTASGQSLQCYWKPQIKRDNRFRDPLASAEALREVYTTAVRCRLRGTGGIGSMISAGWDSSSVTAIAARLLAEQGRRMTSFTAVPRDGFGGPMLNGRLVDESEIAAEMLRDFPNVDHVRVSSATRSHLAEIEAHSRFTDLPVNAPMNIAWLSRIADEARSRGIRVLLSGDGGNLTTSYNGYGTLPDLFRRGKWLALSRLLVRLARQGHSLRWGLTRAIGPFLPAGFYRSVMRAAGRDSPFELFRDTGLSPEFADSMNLQAIADESGWDMEMGQPLPPAVGERTIRHGHMDSGHARVAMNARFGVDLRDPTIDRRVVELCLAIPGEHYLRDGMEAAVFRDAMAGVLPPWLLEHRHRGLQSADWYEGLVAARSELAEHIERLARSRLGSRALDVERLRALVAALPDPATPVQELAKSEWASPRVLRVGGQLLRTLNLGHFILRTEGSNQ
ncbi:MAG TPA: asparagine synthase-related protein [Steroidobacteraceae bacterium]|nr:asparagine synthase-related protein [Steroidobacteraceae bacterium]